MLSDQPITTAKDDLLGRAPFARQVASALLSCPVNKKGSFAIGLFGGWGSGKTSILNMVLEEIEQRAAKKRADDPDPIIIQFNPWLYPSDELLPGQLLGALAAELKKPKRGDRLNKAGRAMEKYLALMRAYLSPETVQAAGSGEDAPMASSMTDQAQSILERKQKIAKHLNKQDKKIYVIMDDIDRLSSKEIRYVLQLASAVAGFPHMVYLLSFDQEVVVSALNKEMDGNGLEYLKKFIQLQFTVPAPDGDRIRDILSEYIIAWLSTQPDLNYDHTYYTNISPYIFQCITTIRDVYRFTNTFRYQYESLGNEVNFVDLMAVTALQLHIPQALPWICEHRDDLLRGGGLAYQSADAAHRQTLRQEHLRMLTELSESDSKTLIPLIGHMFPRYGKNILGVYGEEFDARFVRMRRMCCEEFFDLYFMQSTEKLEITQQEILRTIQEMDAKELHEYISGLDHEDRRNAYLSHLPHYLADIPKDKLPTFFTEVIWLSRLPESKTPKDKPFQRSFFHECCYCALCILAQMEDAAKVQTLKEATDRAEKPTIPALITLLQRILQHNPDADSIEINAETIKTYLRKLLNKIHAIALGGGWMDSHNPLPVLEYWKQADSVSFGVYFQNLLQDDRNAARLVSCLVQRFDHGINMEYQYGDMNGKHAFSREFPLDVAKAAILRLRATDAFLSLPEDVRLDCVALMLMDENLGRVTHQDVLDAYSAWLRGDDVQPKEAKQAPDAVQFEDEPAEEPAMEFDDQPAQEPAMLFGNEPAEEPVLEQETAEKKAARVLRELREDIESQKEDDDDARYVKEKIFQIDDEDDDDFDDDDFDDEDDDY